MSAVKPRWSDMASEPSTPRRAEVVGAVNAPPRCEPPMLRRADVIVAKTLSTSRGGQAEAGRKRQHRRATWRRLCSTLAGLAPVKAEMVCEQVRWFLLEQYGPDTRNQFTFSRDFCTPREVMLLADALSLVFPCGFVLWLCDARRDPNKCAEVHFTPFAAPQRYRPSSTRVPLALLKRPGYVRGSFWLQA